MAIVKSRPNETAWSLIQRFKRAVMRENIVEEAKERMFYRDKSQEKLQKIRKLRFIETAKRRKDNEK